MITIINNLRKIREEKGMSQKELAKRINVSVSCLCRYERGLRQPNINTAMQIADELCVTFDTIWVKI